MAEGPSESGPEFKPEVPSRTWRIAARLLINLPLLSPPLYYLLSIQVIILNFPLFVFKLTQGIMSVVTTFTGHADFFVAVCLLFMPWLIPISDCTYLSLFVVRFPNAHISSGLRIFTFSRRIFCSLQCFLRFSMNPFPYKLKSISICLLNTILVCSIGYITYHLTPWKNNLETIKFWCLTDAVCSLTKYCTWH